MTTPTGRSPRVATTAEAPPDSSANAWSRLALDVDERERRVHDLADGPLDDRRVAEGAIEQALLGDRADDALDASPSGCSETGSWLMPYSWSIAIASPTRWVVRARTSGGQRAGVVTVAEQVLDADDGAGRREQAVGPHPLVVVDLGQVAPAAVGEEDDDDRVRRRPASRPGRATTSRAATIAVPHEPPARIPSSRVSRRAIAKASRSLTRTQRSMTDGS